MENHTKSFPIGHVVGFLLSLLFTIAAAWVALKTELSLKTIMIVIGAFAFIQAGLQLYMFMHMNEGEDGNAQTINVAYGFFIAIVTVFGSIWIMSAGH
jgi:cytochrome aa3-600 menaquinol oxidase subunit IV